MNRYAIELGVDDPATGYRECVGETGPFLTKLGAERAMRQTFGKRANLAARFSEYGENSHLAHLPVVGATIEHFSDDHGTFESWDY